MLIVYSNTATLLLALGVLAALPSVLRTMLRSMCGRTNTASRRSTARMRGAMSDRLLEQLPLMAAVILSLVGAVLVAIAFLHGEIRATPASEIPGAVSWERSTDSREFALNLVYGGVAGLVYLGAAVVITAWSPMRFRAFWTATTRWRARAAGWGALVTVLLTPALLDVLLSALRLRI